MSHHARDATSNDTRDVHIYTTWCTRRPTQPAAAMEARLADLSVPCGGGSRKRDGTYVKCEKGASSGARSPRMLPMEHHDALAHAVGALISQ
eukprot:CAMPEP_0181168032 /NCGR_PEP_ID=MMETSP1096-20121128/42_1 /TAXON_ID=156174 ORGANISM="Chrysochromulina ericina, Strain CCMP281" /NCGR_SAMPLE_ID=MMETSP1096 /ASSEMBLY_ACC=CAM_ASM_000453 /LENGTH=91 /DNA_ID=CAMNT_0023255351 /DNA_START=34 /DNA_END=309 /DNA_ORIENTATION=-